MDAGAQRRQPGGARARRGSGAERRRPERQPRRSRALPPGEGAIAVRQNEFPLVFNNGVEFVRFVINPVALVRIFSALDAADEGEEVESIDRLRGQLCADQAGESREQIDVHAGFFADRPGGDFPGPSHHARHPHATLPRGSFALAQRIGRARMGAVGEPGAVVTRENDKGIFIETVRADRVENLPDRPVNLSDNIAVEPALRRPSEAVAHVKRHVRLRVRHVEEKRFFTVAIDEVDGLCREPGRQHLLIGLVDDADAVVAVKQRERREALRGGMLRPHVIGIGNPEILVKALRQREELLVIPEMPFAEGGSRVALRFKKLGHGRLVGIEPVAAAGTEGAMDAEAIGITTGQEPGPGGRADRLRGIPLRETTSLRRESIEVRGLVAFRTEAADVGVTEIVGENDHDIGKALGSDHGKNEREEAKEGRNGEFDHKKGWKFGWCLLIMPPVERPRRNHTNQANPLSYDTFSPFRPLFRACDDGTFSPCGGRRPRLWPLSAALSSARSAVAQSAAPTLAT